MTSLQSNHPDADTLFHSRYANECRWLHRIMFWLMLGQLPVGLALAFYGAPYTGIGQFSHVQLHVWSVLIFGGAISGFALTWIRYWPDQPGTRHVIAITQVAWSMLLIDLGSLTVTSKGAGQGTTIALRIPFKPAEKVHRPSAQSVGKSTRRHRYIA